MNLTWFWLSLFFALWTSIGTSILKNLTSKIQVLLLVLVTEIVLLPFMFILIQFSGGIPYVNFNFYPLILAAAIIDSAAAILSIYALKISPISLMSPISSFNPVFTTIIASLVLHEVLSPIKYLGIFIIILGSYFLNITDLKGGLLLPFKKLFTNRGILLFLLANLLYAITPIFQKQAIFQTRPVIPLFTSFSEGLIFIFFLIPIVLIKTRNQIPQIKNNWKILLIMGPFGALAQLAAFTAYSQANLGLVTSVFKFSTLFTIIWGFLFFKEQRIWERLLGATVMILGTILLLR